MNHILKNVIYYLTMLVIVGIILFALYFLYVWRNDQPINHDYYESFKDMKAHTKEYRDWKISTTTSNNNDILITAIHGGGIEPGSSELAKLISKKGDFNLYSFEGLLKSDNQKLHITSTTFDEPKLIKMSKKSKTIVSVHGLDEDKKVVYIGGQDKGLAKSIKNALEKKGFNVEDSPNYVNGDSKHNIINQNGSGSGVQLEISTKYRQQFFENKDFSRSTRENVQDYNKDIFKFANAVTKGIKDNKIQQKSSPFDFFKNLFQ
ncbi:poly-gamma-glutamate hydrolase family protein [Staphylococcus sp. Marseille-Q5304]|uniref:poly-gamma-glutamate hydrolase family protein n=1 Tax=Staphylococcus sp. Marseille-Q5304 TaxID=2942200 RepID=UPI002073A72E|nr:poly-gamma-glutamate hydrolase family protein [Staphylococcus sp. Marseille-Q5304]